MLMTLKPREMLRHPGMLYLIGLKWSGQKEIKVETDAGVEFGSDDEHHIYCKNNNSNIMARTNESTCVKLKHTT
jgi:hypothetical protein